MISDPLQKQKKSLSTRVFVGKVMDNGLTQVKEEGWTGFSKGWQGAQIDFPRALPLKNPQGDFSEFFKY